MSTDSKWHEYTPGDLAILSGGGFHELSGLGETVIIKLLMSWQSMGYQKPVYRVEPTDKTGAFARSYPLNNYPGGVPVYVDSMTPLPMDIIGDNDDDCI